MKFPGLIHPGLIGTAPRLVVRLVPRWPSFCLVWLTNLLPTADHSAELLKIWNEREASLVAEEGTPMEKTLCGCLATRPLAASGLYLVTQFIVPNSVSNYRMILLFTVSSRTQGGHAGKTWAFPREGW